MRTDISPTDTWQGLPLSPAQNREVLNYIGRCERAGIGWNTPELRAMLDDMLSPPEIVDDGCDDIARCTENEVFAATHEEPDDKLDDDTR